MSSTELARREQSLERLDNQQLEYIANTSFVPAHYRGKPPEIMACVLTGRELGLGDLESLRSIYIVDGKPTFSAELMVRLVRRAGHSITGQFSTDKTAAKAKGKRADTGDEMEFTYTLDMAKAAGLLGKKNWQQYQQAMLWARAATQLCRMLFPDVLGGVSYTREELDELGPTARQMTTLPRPTVDAEVAGSEGGSRPVTATVPSPSDESPLPKEEDGTGDPSAPPDVADASSSESGGQASFEIPASARKPVSAP